MNLAIKPICGAYLADLSIHTLNTPIVGLAQQEA
jgi:hypothetical protein